MTNDDKITAALKAAITEAACAGSTTLDESPRDVFWRALIERMKAAKKEVSK